MKRKPLLHPTTTNRPSPRPPAGATTASRLRRWARRRRGDAAGHLLRGLCYGIGTGAAGLVFWWLEQHL
ncbi:hypothetical protein ABZ023_01645 [Streptomyces sp. NPDC006367]|uniref:hypothetical protein n=1 Tax=unclassified Streptomyces TaxID=2593676 RepID=UPI0033A1AD7B